MGTKTPASCSLPSTGSVLPSLLQGYCYVSLVPQHPIPSHLMSREWGILLKPPQAPGVQHLPPGIGEMLRCLSLISAGKAAENSKLSWGKG